MTTGNRASIYLRLSRAADETNVSLEGMLADVRAILAREGLAEVALHIDDGVSGGRRDRAEFIAWLDDARTGAADVLATFHTDRLTREGLNVAASILDVVEGKDPETGRPAHAPARLLDAKGLDSRDGDAFRFRFVIQAEVGRAERERIRDRARAKARRLRQAGRWSGGPAPYGYASAPNPDGPGRVLTIEPSEAAVIREATEAVLSGDTLGRVVRRLNHAGAKPRRAKAWSRQALGQILTGDAILGRIVLGGKPLRDDQGKIIAPFPAIISEAESAALRSALAVRTPDARKGGRKPARLLSGLLACHSCGARLQIGVSGPRSVNVYRCPTKAGGGICTKPVSASVNAIEEHVTNRFLRAVGAMPMMRERVTVSTAGELAAVDAEIREVLASLATSADAVLFQRLQRLQAERAELAAAQPQQRSEWVPTGRTMAEHWAQSLVDDRREMLASAVREFILLPGQRGRHGFAAERLIWRWADDDAAEREELLSE